MANKLLRIMIEGFMGGFQIYCGIFWAKKIWKVPFLGEGGGGAVRFLSTFLRGVEEWFKTI